MTYAQLAFAEESWSEQAWHYIVEMDPGDKVTAETLRRAIGDPPEANAVGAIFMRASRKHLLRYVGHDERTARDLARGRWNRIWERTEKEATTP